MAANETVKIPQADVLWDVVRVAEAVSRGIDTTEAIGAYIGAKGPRQGLYYTQAARILGLVDDGAEPGTIALTVYGRAFVSYDIESQRQAMRRLLRQREPTSTVITALRVTGELDLDGVACALQQIAPLADSTAHRRAQTIIRWLMHAGIATWNDGRLRYVPSSAPTGGFLRSQ